MVEEKTRLDAAVVEPDSNTRLTRIDEDLNIMDRHAAELAEAEDDIQQSMRRWDREYKDARLHSIPKPRKHLR